MKPVDLESTSLRRTCSEMCKIRAVRGCSCFLLPECRCRFAFLLCLCIRCILRRHLTRSSFARILDRNKITVFHVLILTFDSTDEVSTGIFTRIVELLLKLSIDLLGYFLIFSLAHFKPIPLQR